jgi:hypothetical protein
MDFSGLVKLADSWYKALMVLGGGLFAGSLFFPVHGISSQQALLLSGGVFLIGLGEWKNHKELSWWKEANAYTGGPALMQALVRKADPVGVVFELAGALSFAVGVWKIAHH